MSKSGRTGPNWKILRIEDKEDRGNKYTQIDMLELNDREVRTGETRQEDIENVKGRTGEDEEFLEGEVEK